MKRFFGKRVENLFDLQIMPRFVLELMRKYLRLEVEGIDHVPKHGRAIVVPNHSGWSGFDAAMIGNEIFKTRKRIPRVMAHKAFFMGDIKVLSHKMGLEEASTENGMRLLSKNNVVVLFPEGEKGNFKPTSQRYHLQEFKRGFIRMAISTRAPIVPAIVIGAEETHINLASFKITKQLIPLPLNFLPLPAKWKIKFLEPIHLHEYSEDDVENHELMNELAGKVRDKMQVAIDEEIKNRKWVYFPPQNV